MGIFDQFISARLLDRYPQLYQLGQKGEFVSTKTIAKRLQNKTKIYAYWCWQFKTSNFWSWLINGFYHSLILYFVSSYIYLYDLPQRDGTLSGHWLWGTALYTAVLATVLGKAALVTKSECLKRYLKRPWLILCVVCGRNIPSWLFLVQWSSGWFSCRDTLLWRLCSTSRPNITVFCLFWFPHRFSGEWLWYYHVYVSWEILRGNSMRSFLSPIYYLQSCLILKYFL